MGTALDSDGHGIIASEVLTFFLDEEGELDEHTDGHIACISLYDRA